MSCLLPQQLKTSINGESVNVFIMFGPFQLLFNCPVNRAIILRITSAQNNT